MINAVVIQAVREDVEMYAAICGVSTRESHPGQCEDLVVFHVHARPTPFAPGEAGVRGVFHLHRDECGDNPDLARDLAEERWTQCVRQMWAVAARGLATVATGKPKEKVMTSEEFVKKVEEQYKRNASVANVTLVKRPDVAELLVSFDVVADMECPKAVEWYRELGRTSVSFWHEEIRGSAHRNHLDDLIGVRWENVMTALWEKVATVATGESDESQPGPVPPDVSAGAEGQSALPPVHC